jgi:hypothetical protein
MGNTPFSDVLQTARRKIEGWTLLLKYKKGLKVSSRKLARTLKKADIHTKTGETTITEIQDELHKATKQYYIQKKSAAQLRDNYLQRLAAAVTATGNLKKETVIKQLQQREQQRSTAKKIKYLRGKLNRGSTTMVTVTNEDGTTTDIFDKNLMEKAIISSNQRKFRQSFGTPFYNAPYNRLFGYQGLTPSSKQTLMGTFNPPPNASTHMVNFLSHLVMPQSIRNNPTNMDMTLESFISYWRKAK